VKNQRSKKNHKSQELSEETGKKDSKQLLKRFLSGDVRIIELTAKRIFTVAIPKIPNNDQLYVPATTKENMSQQNAVACGQPLMTAVTNIITTRPRLMWYCISKKHYKTLKHR